MFSETNRAVSSGQWPFAVIWLWLLLWPLRAYSQITPASSEPSPNLVAGKTMMARGAVHARDATSSRALARLSPVFGSDTVQTGTQSVSQLRMGDGGLLSLQAESELVIRQYLLAADGSADAISLELLKGGLRTITGVLPQSGRNYQLETPVATIGVRGTHYEAVLQQGDLYLAGWDGVIDIRVTVSGADQQFSLGPNQPYRFAIVRANGEVTFLLRPPTLFAGILTAPISDQTEFRPAPPPVTNPQSDDAWHSALWLPREPLSTEKSGLGFDDNRQLTADWSMTLGSRSGVTEFNQLSQHNLLSSAGTLTNLSMSMRVDFDNAWVPAGQLSFTDAGGEWFAVFNGVFANEGLALYINFASHGNALANGNISAVLLNEQQIFGQLTLTEIADPAIRLDGSFVLTEQP